MEASNKVIAFNTFGKILHTTLNGDALDEAIGVQEEEARVGKAREVLDEMEELWEIDHNTVELRDKIHLFRCYLKRCTNEAV
jgi:hypothetical protein